MTVIPGVSVQHQVGRIFGRMLMVCALLSWVASTHAVVLNVKGGGWTGEMNCPPESRTKPPARKKPQAEPQRVPEEDEIDGLPDGGAAGNQPLFVWPHKVGLGGKPLRVGLWGDSHAAARFFSDEIVKSLGLDKSRVAQQFLPPTMGMSGVRLPVKNYCRGPGWKLRFSYREQAADSQSAAGLAGLESLESNSYLWLDVRSGEGVSNINGMDIVFSRLPAGQSALVAIAVDNEGERFVSLTPDNQEPVRIRAESPIAVIKIRVIVGDVTVEGFVPQYLAAPALYFDTLGIPGATVAGWEKLNPQDFRGEHYAPNYDVVMLEYGTNEGNVRVFDAESYRNSVRAALTNLKTAYPDAVCVLIGAPDRGVLTRQTNRRRNQIKSRDALHYSAIHSQINRIQRTAASEFSCAFWDWQQAMGGNGGVYHWFHQTPILMSKDLTHLTIPGYQKSARMFEDWLGLRSVMPAAN